MKLRDFRNSRPEFRDHRDFRAHFTDFRSELRDSRDFQSKFRDFRDFASNFWDFRPDFRSKFRDFRDFASDFRDFRSDFRISLHQIPEVVGPSLQRDIEVSKKHKISLGSSILNTTLIKIKLQQMASTAAARAAPHSTAGAAGVAVALRRAAVIQSSVRHSEKRHDSKTGFLA